MHETTSRGLLLKAFAVIVTMLTSPYGPTLAAASDAELAAVRARIEGALNRLETGGRLTVPNRTDDVQYSLVGRSPKYTLRERKRDLCPRRRKLIQ